MRLVTFIILLVSERAKPLDIDPLKTITWGPGLKPVEVTLRARYIFLQLIDSHGQNLTESPGENMVTGQVQGESLNGSPCRIWTQIYDCKDGSFIMRYKIFNTCYNIKIKVKIKEQELLLKSETKGPAYEEECYCPNPSIANWLNHYQCQRNYTQIYHDLASFSNIDFDRIRQDIIKRYDQPNSVSICHYVLKSNIVYRQCYGQYVGFKIFMDAILLSLARKVLLPDIEFFVNLGDWPLVPNKGPFYPIFSWCGSEDTKDIVMPTYDITESSLEAMGRVMLDTLSVQGNAKVPWNNKIEQLFWRGRDSRRERLDLIDISRKHPELFNVSITNFFFFKDEIDKYGPGQSHVSFFQFFKYKYQLNIDGTVAAYRFPYLLAGDSLVFKQKSKYYEFFYKDLIPGLHYISVKSDLSDLVEKIKWAKEHDKDGLKIVKSARQFARDHLLPRDILCYYTVLLYEWSKIIKSKVKVLNNMEEVPQPSHSCQCHLNLNLKDEL